MACRAGIDPLRAVVLVLPRPSSFGALQSEDPELCARIRREPAVISHDGRHTCSGERIARHSSSDLVLLALDIFRKVTNFAGVDTRRSVGREIYRDDERAAQISDDNVNVMCDQRHE